MRTPSLTDTVTPVTFPRLSTDPAVSGAVEEGRARGYAAGYADGLRRAEAEAAVRHTELEHASAREREHAEQRMAHAFQAVVAAAAALDARTADSVASADASLIDGAVLLAEAVIGLELANAATSSTSVLTRVLGHPAADSVAELRMNPDDLAALGPDLRASVSLNFVADATLGPGDAVASLPAGYLDLHIRSSLDRAVAALRGEAV